MSTTINCVMFTFSQGIHPLFLARFQPNDENNRVLINSNVPVAAVNFCQQLLHIVLNVPGNLNRSKPLCDVLEVAFHSVRFTNGNNSEFHEKMVIMVTDFAQNLSAHFPTLSDEFNRRGMTAVVVAAAIPSTLEILRTYSTLARNTGGEYLLSWNAVSVLERVIHSTIYDGYTLRQAFYHMAGQNNPAVPNNMNEQSEITDGVDELEFNHGLPQ